MLGVPDRKAPGPGEDVSGPEPDARESEAWFELLDEGAQDVVRQRWLDDELEWERIGFAERRDLRTALLQGLGLVAGLQLVLVVALGMVLGHFTGGVTVGDAIAQLGMATLFGLGLGLAWRLVGAGVMICTLSAMGVVAALEWIVVGSGWLGTIALIAGPLMAGFVAQYLGTRREELPGA